MRKLTVFIALYLTLSACSLLPQKRYENVHQKMTGTNDINILLDVFVRDRELKLSGLQYSYDMQKNHLALSQFKALLEEQLSKRGYSPRYSFSGSGLLYDTYKKKNDIYTHNFAQYKRLRSRPDSERTAWEQNASLIFLENLMFRASRLDTDKNKHGLIQTHFDQQDIPDVARDLPSPILALVSIKLESNNKTGGSVAFIAGTPVYIDATVEFVTVDIAMMNSKTGEIIWHNSAKGTSVGYAYRTLKAALNPLPTNTGEIISVEYEFEKIQRMKNRADEEKEREEEQEDGYF
jgi:hypothetical protein